MNSSAAMLPFTLFIGFNKGGELVLSSFRVNCSLSANLALHFVVRPCGSCGFKESGNDPRSARMFIMICIFKLECWRCVLLVPIIPNPFIIKKRPVFKQGQRSHQR